MIDDNLLEKACRSYCELLQLNPDELVSHEYGEDLTPIELAEIKDTVPGVLYCSPRWKAQRRSMFFTLARNEALRKAFNKE